MNVGTGAARTMAPGPSIPVKMAADPDEEGDAMSEQRTVTPAGGDVRHRAKLVVETADVRITEYALKPGDANPWHYHSEVSDRVYCLEGLIGVNLRQPAKSLVLRPGDSYEIPARTVHYVGNAGDGTSRYLLVQALGHYDFIRSD